MAGTAICSAVWLVSPKATSGFLLRASSSGLRFVPGFLDAVRAHAKQELATLPRHLRELEDSPEPYRVEIAPALHELATKLDRESAA